MRYLRFLVPAAALSCAFGFLLPEFKVTGPGGFIGFVLTIGLGTAFSLFYNGYKAVEPRLIRRLSGEKLRPEHVFYLGLLGIAALSSLALVGIASFTSLLTVGGVLAAVNAGVCLTTIGTALVPSSALRQDTVTEPKPEPVPAVEPTPVPAVEPAPVPDTAAAAEKAVVNQDVAADTAHGKSDVVAVTDSGKPADAGLQTDAPPAA